MSEFQMICSSNFRISSFVPKDNMGISQIPTNKTSTLKKGKKKKQPQKSSLALCLLLQAKSSLFYRILPRGKHCPTVQPCQRKVRHLVHSRMPCRWESENVSHWWKHSPGNSEGLSNYRPRFFWQKRNCVDIRERSCSEWFWEGWKNCGDVHP